MKTNAISDNISSEMSDSTQTLIYSFSLFAFALGIRVAHWLRAGYPLARTPPDTKTYIETCEILATDPLSVISATKGPEYLGFTIPYCGFQTILSDSFQYWIAVQVALSAVAVVLVYLTAKSVVGHDAGIVSGIALAISYDAFKWDIAILAESLTIFAIALSVYTYTVYRRKPSRLYGFATGFSFLWLALVRPHGAPIVVVWLVSDAIIARIRGTTPLFPSSYITAGVVVVLSLVPINTLLRGGAKSGSVSGAWREGWVVYNGKPRFFIPQYKPGAVTSADPVEFVLNLPDLLIVFTLRALVFFNPIITFSYSGPNWRLFHTLTLLAVVPLALVGLGRLLYQRKFGLIQMWTTPLIVILGITMVTFMSQTYRYRAVINPVFALLVGVAVSPFLSKLRQSSIGQTN